MDLRVVWKTFTWCQFAVGGRKCFHLILAIFVPSLFYELTKSLITQMCEELRILVKLRYSLRQRSKSASRFFKHVLTSPSPLSLVTLFVWRHFYVSIDCHRSFTPLPAKAWRTLRTLPKCKEMLPSGQPFCWFRNKFVGFNCESIINDHQT